jgi:hypothetical protein
MDLFAIKLVVHVQHNLRFPLLQVLYPLVHLEVLFGLDLHFFRKTKEGTNSESECVALHGGVSVSQLLSTSL